MKKSKLLMPLAGIATIGAVAPIVTLASCNNGTALVNDADKAFLTKINDYMKYGNTYVAPHKAITALKDLGCDVLSFRLSNSTSEFAFDVNVKKFIIMNGDTVAAAPDSYKMEDASLVFKFTDKYNKNSKYGQYLLDNYDWTTPAEVFEVKTSIDVGTNTNIKNMKYVGDSNNAKKVLLRTYCENLTVQGQKDTIIHAGESNNVDVNYLCSNTCNYMELGKVAYMYAENTVLDARKIDSIDSAEIDVLEVGTDVTAADDFNKDCVRAQIGELLFTTWPQYLEIGEVTETKSISDLLNDGYYFIRLTTNVTLTSALDISNKQFILDLAGCTITVDTNVTGISFNMASSSAESKLVLIDSWRSGSITLNNSYISVVGTSTYPASLYLEGANITYAPTVNGRKGAVMVGDDATAAQAATQHSRVYMYGGVITATTSSTTHELEVSGIYAKNNSYVQIIYGSIYSSTNCVRTVGNCANSYIDIYHATLKNTNINFGECIFLSTGKLNIWGGTFEGHTCVGIHGGHTNIAGGYFHSTGTYKALEKVDDSTEQGICGDGSVICAELVNNASTTAYGLNPSLTVTNATLQSDNSFILQVYRNNSDTNINQFFEVDFFDGVYYYGNEISMSSEYFVGTGIRVAETIQTNTPDNFRINQVGGTWVNTEKY